MPIFQNGGEPSNQRALVAGLQVDKVQLVLPLDLFHQFEVEFVLDVWVPLLVESVVPHQLLQAFKSAPGRLLYCLLVIRSEVIRADDLFVLLKVMEAVHAVEASDKARHKLIHRDRDILGFPAILLLNSQRL